MSLQYLTGNVVAAEDTDLQNQVTFVEGFEVKTHSDGSPIFKSGKPVREPIFKTIPREEWVRMKAVEQASKELSRKIEREFGHSVTVGRQPAEVMGEERLLVEIEAESSAKPAKTDRSHSGDLSATPSVSELEAFTPDKVDGEMPGSKSTETYNDIPVIIEKSKTELHANNFDAEYDPVPGGANLNHGTCAYRAYSYDESTFVMCGAGHAYKNALQNGDSIEQPRGRSVSNSGSSNIRAEVRKKDPDNDIFDGGYFVPTISITDKIADDGNNYRSGTLGGIKSWDWLNSSDGASEEYIMQGAVSGYQTGSLWSLKNDIGQKVMWSTADTESGDSGGPHLVKQGNTFYAVALHAFGRYSQQAAQYTENGNISGGNSAERVEDFLDIDIF